MKWQDLRDNFVADIFKNATTIIKERGFTKGVTIDPASGRIDARGALLLAAGAKPNKIHGFTTEPEEAGIPIYWLPKVQAALFVIEALYGDIDEWCDNPNTTQQVIETAFRKAENLIRTSII